MSSIHNPNSSLESPPYDLAYWRTQFPILGKWIHVANCSQSPLSDASEKAVLGYLDSLKTKGMAWDLWIGEVTAAKNEFARLINADPSEIAIGTSVSQLTATVASALEYSGKRSTIALTEAEFPSIGYVWLAQQKRGAHIQFIPVRNHQIDEIDYEHLVDERTLLTSICDVYYYNGFKQDLDAIIPKIHERGSLVYVDAYQGVGTHPIDVKALNIDMLCAGNLKYLLGVPGVAFLYVRKDLIPQLEPMCTGWFGQENPFSFDIHNLTYAKDARRFENGTPPIITAVLARAGMEIINAVGVEKIQAWTDMLSRYCIEGLQARDLKSVSPVDIKFKAPTTAIQVSAHSHEIENRMKAKGVIASARGDVIRIAPHFFTKKEEIDIALDALVGALKD